MEIEFNLQNEYDTRDIAYKLANIFSSMQGGVVFLYGDLGVGKTFLIRNLLFKIGVKQTIKSPTYSLVETYKANNMDIYHCDFYRLSNAEEVIQLGIDKWLTSNCLVLIEWPEKVENILEAHVLCKLQHTSLYNDTRKFRIIKAEKSYLKLINKFITNKNK